MDFASFDNIISFAADKEKEAVEFYDGLAKQAPNTGAKELLQGFAREEEKHYKMLKEFEINKPKLDEYKFKWITDIKRSDYLVDAPYDKGMGYPDLLRLAMKREEASLKLYNELLEKAEKQDIKKLFKMLCQEEAGHKQKLETMYDDYMAKQGD
ncbi:Rubrerythrin [uncultured Desulfobacterium sp.]|uniref:Rubrerythrin n=1 Tax=uncultured Desulfobacterium sp. TaxID=201089 RepID=A0A445MYS1_9BACT|nr:Rubrerythrin [uncultured Desulfobacterium sp.]